MTKLTEPRPKTYGVKTESDDTAAVYLIDAYINYRKNPTKHLEDRAKWWFSDIVSNVSIAEDPYRATMSFNEAFEKHILPGLTRKTKSRIADVLDIYPLVGTISDSSKANPHTDTESVFTKIIDWTHIERDDYTDIKEKLSISALEITNLQLLQRIDELEAEVRYLKSQNAFNDVLTSKTTRRYEELPF